MFGYHNGRPAQDCAAEASSTPLNSHAARLAQAKHRSAPRRGVAFILVLVLLVVFIATAAFSVDVARMHLVNAELRSATDAAAKAAVTKLALTQDLNAARQAAIQVAAANSVGGNPLILEAQDITFGRVQILGSGPMAFVAGGTPYGAAQIRSRKTDSSPSGSIPMVFGRVLGKDTYNTELTSTAARLDRDVCLVLDRSGSMLGQKLTDLKAGVGIFLDTFNNPTQPQRVGLASYSTTSTLDQQLTTDFEVVRQKVNDMEADGMTNIGEGMFTGQTVLEGGRDPRFVEKTMVLMTDGIHNQATSPEAAAAAAKANNMVIHTLTFGEDADKDRMRAIADLTGGTYHHAPDGAALMQAFEDIALTIRTSLTQ